MKSDDRVIRSRLNYAELGGMNAIGGNGGDGGLGALVHVVFQHLPNVHSVDVVRSKNRYVMRVRLLNEVNVLINRVRRAAVPILIGGAHLRWHGDDEIFLQ